MNTPPPRLSRLAVLVFLLSVLPIVGCILLVLAGIVFPDYFAPNPGHSSVIYSAASNLVFLLVICSMVIAPVALLVGILARIYRRKTELKGAIFAWLAVAVSSCLLICFVASWAVPTLIAPFILSNRATPSPPLSVDRGAKIVFATNRNLNYDIYSMDPDGSRQTRLTDLPTDEFGGACSSDGRFIIFTTAQTSGKTIYRYEDSEVWVMRRDGSNRSKLGEGAGKVSLSPDGQRVVLNAPGVGGDMDIYTVPLAGGPFTPLTRHPASDTTPDWSHDGSQIAFASYRDGTSFIYVMNADGTDQKRLTTRTVAEYGPEWSPDGRTIAFWSPDASGSNQIYLVNSDGTQLRQITSGSGGNEAPTWSPDGTMLAFASRRLGNKNIYVTKVDGSGQEQLTTDPGEDLNPCWLPAQGNE